MEKGKDVQLKTAIIMQVIFSFVCKIADRKVESASEWEVVRGNGCVETFVETWTFI